MNNSREEIVWWRQIDNCVKAINNQKEKVSAFVTALSCDSWRELINVYEYARIFRYISEELDNITEIEKTRDSTNSNIEQP